MEAKVNRVEMFSVTLDGVTREEASGLIEVLLNGPRALNFESENAPRSSGNPHPVKGSFSPAQQAAIRILGSALSSGVDTLGKKSDIRQSFAS